jgi:hypothetical protein|eukprot:g6323.t1
MAGAEKTFDFTSVPIVSTLDVFPETASVKNDSRLPWGIVVQPFLPLRSFLSKKDIATVSKTLESDAEAIRCKSCDSYLNAACRAHSDRWQCVMCFEWNDRDGKRDSSWATNSIELDLPCYEYTIGLEEEIDPTSSPRLRYVAVVDMTAGAQAVGQMQTVLLGVVRGLPAGLWFSLVVVTDTQVGIFDLQSSIPHVAYVDMEQRAPEKPLLGRSSLPLLDALNGLDNFGVCVQEQTLPLIARAVQSLTAAAKLSNGSANPVLTGAVLSVAESLDQINGETSTFGGARVIVFTSERATLDAPAAEAFATFISGRAESCAKIGISFDLLNFTIGSAGGGLNTALETLSPLAQTTGGFFLNVDVEGLKRNDARENTVVMEVIGRVAAAFKCELSVHTSAGFILSQTSDDLTPMGPAIPLEDRSWSVGRCDPETAFAFDFEFTSSVGFSEYHRRSAFVQFSLRHFYFCHTRGRLLQRVRVFTRRFESGRDFANMYANANFDGIFGIMSRKLIQAGERYGLEEGKELISDWLVGLFSRFIKEKSVDAAVDRLSGEAKLKACAGLVKSDEKLKYLARFLFGLSHLPVFEASASPRDRLEAKIYALSCCPTSLLDEVYPSPSAFQNQKDEKLFLQWFDTFWVNILAESARLS